MKLTPIPEEINKSGDLLFNERYAKRMFEIVSKMDDDSAEMFAYFVAADVMEQDIEKNFRTLQRHVDEIVDQRLQVIRKAASVVSQGVKDRRELDEFISKAEDGFQNN